MKKYVKPELFFESFELSQQIAACEFDSNNSIDGNPTGNCKFTGGDDSFFPGLVIFLDRCGNDGSRNAYDLGVCYHNSSDITYGIFNS